MKITDDTPMMSNAEIKIIDDLLDEHKPKFCLEWGSGNSTVYFPSKHPFIKHWLAVEHNGHYVRYLESILPDNASVIWVDQEWYIDSVKLGRKFDFIFIDGQDREECLDEAMRMLNPNGFILLHDSGRPEYQGFIQRHKGTKLSEGEVPLKNGGFAHRGLTIFFKEGQ